MHVLIGDNGAGKSTIVRSISAVLVGPEQIAAVLPVWREWLSKDAKNGEIELLLKPDSSVDLVTPGQPSDKNFNARFSFTRQDEKVTMNSNIDQAILGQAYRGRRTTWGKTSRSQRRNTKVIIHSADR